MIMKRKQSKRNGSKPARGYLPVDLAEASRIGALCYVTGTLSGLDGAFAIIDHASIAYQDLKGRVHAQLFPAAFCQVRGIERIAPGAMVRIAGEAHAAASATFFTGALYEAMAPAFEYDPASAVHPGAEGCFYAP